LGVGKNQDQRTARSEYLKNNRIKEPSVLVVSKTSRSH